MASLSELLRSGASDSTEAKKATVADLYKKILGREAGAEETGLWADYIDSQNPTQSTLALADRLAQSEEGQAYGKSNPKDVYKAMVGLSQADSPFAGMDTPYSNMRYAGTSNKTNYGGETTPDSVTTTHMFQDENGGIITTDQFGQPIEYSPGRGWYQEQYQKHPDALRQYGYRNQTYLAAGPLDQTYKFNGYDVPVKAGEMQVDPKTGQFITGKTGDYKPLELKPADYDWFNDWGGPAMVVAIPALAAGGAYLAGAYGAGAAGGGAFVPAAGSGASFAIPAGAYTTAGAGATGAMTTAEMMGGAGGAFTPAAGSGASFAIEPGTAYTTAGAGGAFEGANPSVFDAEDMAYGKSFPEGSVPKGSGIFGNTYGQTGLSAMQKAQLIRSGANALNQMTGGTGGGGYSTMAGGYGNGMQAYQRQNPFLSTAQQNTVPDTTTAALTKLLRGYNG